MLCVYVLYDRTPPIRERALSVDKDVVDGQLQTQLVMRTSRSFEVLPKKSAEREGEGPGHDMLSASMSSYSHSGPFGASPM